MAADDNAADGIHAGFLLILHGFNTPLSAEFLRRKPGADFIACSHRSFIEQSEVGANTLRLATGKFISWILPKERDTEKVPGNAEWADMKEAAIPSCILTVENICQTKCITSERFCKTGQKAANVCAHEYNSHKEEGDRHVS